MISNVPSPYAQVITHKHFLVHEQDSCVRFEIHALGLLDDLQAADSDVLFVCETESYEVQHGCWILWWVVYGSRWWGT